MTPYYLDGAVALYLGRCEDVLPELGLVDLVCTDPPYGINYVTNHRVLTKSKTVARPIHGDGLAPTDTVYSLFDHLSPGGAIYWFCTERGIEPFYAAVEQLPMTPKRSLVWDKGNWAAGDLEGDWGVQTEYICWASKGTHKLRGGRPSNLLRHRRIISSIHPTEKPTSLCEEIIARSSDPGAMVLDPYAGSGTTLVAAKNLGRKAIGIEIDESYCEAAAKRLAQEVLPF